MSADKYHLRHAVLYLEEARDTRDKETEKRTVQEALKHLVNYIEERDGRQLMLVERRAYDGTC